MSSLDYMQISENSDYQKRVKYFMQKVATQVIGEDSGTSGHVERVAYANKALGGSANIKEMSIGTVTNSTIASTIDSNPNNQSAITDNDLEFVVTSLWNDFSGADV